LGSVSLAELILMPGTKIYEDRKLFLREKQYFVGFNGEDLGYGITSAYKNELLQADKELYPLLYRDVHISENKIYKNVRNFCTFINYLKKYNIEYKLYKSAQVFQTFYSCLDSYLFKKYGGKEIKIS